MTERDSDLVKLVDTYSNIDFQDKSVVPLAEAFERAEELSAAFEIDPKVFVRGIYAVGEMNRFLYSEPLSPESQALFLWYYLSKKGVHPFTIAHALNARRDDIHYPVQELAVSIDDDIVFARNALDKITYDPDDNYLDDKPLMYRRVDMLSGRGISWKNIHIKVQNDFPRLTQSDIAAAIARTRIKVSAELWPYISYYDDPARQRFSWKLAKLRAKGLAIREIAPILGVDEQFAYTVASNMIATGELPRHSRKGSRKQSTEMSEEEALATTFEILRRKKAGQPVKAIEEDLGISRRFRKAAVARLILDGYLTDYQYMSETQKEVMRNWIIRLRAENEYITVEEMAVITGISTWSVDSIISNLVRYGEIDRRYAPRQDYDEVMSEIENLNSSNLEEVARVFGLVSVNFIKKYLSNEGTSIVMLGPLIRPHFTFREIGVFVDMLQDKDFVVGKAATKGKSRAKKKRIPILFIHKDHVDDVIDTLLASDKLVSYRKSSDRSDARHQNS